MALSLRSINRFANFTNRVTPLSSILDKIHRQLSTSQCDQYSIRMNQKINIKTTENCQTSVVDNRESVYDSVTREHFFTLRDSKTDDRNNICLRFSKPVLDEKNEHLFSEKKGDPLNKPSPEQLHHVYTVLGETLPTIFFKSLDYSIYHPDVIFEDNIRNLTTVGLFSYMRQIALIRTIGHLKFAYVKGTILKITKHPEDSSVKVRWQIKGISALQVVLKFWKYKLWDIKKIFEKTESWYDGFSTFYINSEGKIIKHVADKMMPDSDNVAEDKLPLENAAKLALIIGLIPKFSDLNSIV